MRPAKGSLGNAPRTPDVRSPRRGYLDLSPSKDFPWPFASDEGRRRINFRVDAINVLKVAAEHYLAALAAQNGAA